MSGFQTSAQFNPAPGVEGDFATTNPRATVLAGPGGLVAGDEGVIIGRFAWLSYEHADFNNAPAVANSRGTGPVAGFVHREQQGLISVYLQEHSMLVPAGFAITVLKAGDFWVLNRGTEPVYPGMAVYANHADGHAMFGAPDSPDTATFTGSVEAVSNVVTGTIAGNILTVSDADAGEVPLGATVSGAGVAPGTRVVAQLSGSQRGNGSYAVSIPAQNVAETEITLSYGSLTVTEVEGGQVSLGGVLSGTGVQEGTYITDNINGGSGAGQYVVSSDEAFASTELTSQTNVQTKWETASYAAPGEIVKITSWPQG